MTTERSLINSIRYEVLEENVNSHCMNPNPNIYKKCCENFQRCRALEFHPTFVRNKRFSRCCSKSGGTHCFLLLFWFIFQRLLHQGKIDQLSLVSETLSKPEFHKETLPLTQDESSKQRSLVSSHEGRWEGEGLLCVCFYRSMNFMNLSYENSERVISLNSSLRISHISRSFRSLWLPMEPRYQDVNRMPIIPSYPLVMYIEYVVMYICQRPTV